MPYKDPDKQREYQRKWMQQKDRNRPPIGSNRFFSNACSKMKNKANELGLDFNLDATYLKDIFPVDGKCPALRFTLEKGINGIGTDSSPSLDRINNKLGYTKDNVQWVSRLANQIMSSATPDQVIQVGEYFKRVTEELVMRAKPFSKEDYDKYDSPAKEAMIYWLSQKNPNLIIDDKENFKADLRVTDPDTNKNYLFELETINKWESHMNSEDQFNCGVCKADEFSVPTAKKSIKEYLKIPQEHRPNFTYVTFRSDFKMALMTNIYAILNSERKVIPNRYSQTEEFYIVNKSFSRPENMEIN